MSAGRDRSELRWLLGLLLVTAILYFPGLNGPFLFDDAPNLKDNYQLITEKTTLLDWWGAAQSSGAGVLRRPVTMLSFALQIPDGPPLSAFALKLGNLFIHLICGGLLHALASFLRGAMGIAYDDRYASFPLLAAALWLLTPLFVSTVLYPVQRMAQLSTLFTLLGLVAYARYRIRWSERGATVDEVLALGLWLLFFTLLAIFSKENGVLLPWFVVILEGCLLRGRWGGRDSPLVLRLGAAAAILPLLGFCVVLVWRWDWVLAGYSYRDFAVHEKLWTEMRLLWQYLGWFLLPRLGELGLFHDDLQLSKAWLSPVTTAIATISWCAVIAVGLALRRVYPWLLMAVYFFLAGHSIESGVLALELVFEHRNYLPLVGVALLFGVSLSLLTARFRQAGGATIARLPAVFFLLLFAVSLGSRAMTWSSEMALASAAYGRHPESSRSAHFYASTLLGERNSGRVKGEVAAQYLAVARHEFEKRVLANPVDLSALVMLYIMDSQYVTPTADPKRWFSALEQSVAQIKLKTSEYAAMRVLVRCVNEGGCNPEPERLDAMLGVFSKRFVNPYAGTQLQLQLLENDEDGPAEEKIALLESAIDVMPGQLSLYYPLVSAWLDLDEFAQANLVIMALVRADSSFRHLAAIDALFEDRAE